jgi:TPR repeat protein/uncharacterized caspase-like protein
MIRFALASVFLAVSCTTTHPAVPKRIGLVVGIENYRRLPGLPSSVDDADAVYKAIKKVGFDVEPLVDPSWDRMDAAIYRLKSRVSPGDIVFFYFAGHGFEKANKRYLVPADMARYHASQEDAAIADSFAVDEIRDELRSRGTGLVVSVIDACRRDPFVGAPTIVVPPQQHPLRLTIHDRGRKEDRELAQRGKYFEFYATSSGRSALDKLNLEDEDKNSVFTRLFIKSLKTSSMSFPTIARTVAGQVEQLTSSFGPETAQLPTVETNMSSEFYLASEPAPTLQSAASRDAAASPMPGPDAHAKCDALAASPDDEGRPRSVRGVQRMFIDFTAAIPTCQAAASVDDRDGRMHFQLGRAYHAAGNIDAARQAYLIAERVSYPAALVGLGELSFKEQEGPYPGVKEAYSYFVRAEAGNARGETYLALMYIYDQIRPSISASALDALQEGHRLLLDADRRRDPEAAFWLGRLYHQRDTGVRQDFAVAEAYYHKAERAGHRRAILYLGNLARDRPPYVNRTRDMMDYWGQAARLGSSQATFNLGHYFETAVGGMDGRSQACAYYDQASQMGHRDGWSAYVRLCAAMADAPGHLNQR